MSDNYSNRTKEELEDLYLSQSQSGTKEESKRLLDEYTKRLTQELLDKVGLEPRKKYKRNVTSSGFDKRLEFDKRLNEIEKRLSLRASLSNSSSTQQENKDLHQKTSPPSVLPQHRIEAPASSQSINPENVTQISTFRGSKLARVRQNPEDNASILTKLWLNFSCAYPSQKPRLRGIERLKRSFLRMVYIYCAFYGIVLFSAAIYWAVLAIIPKDVGADKAYLWQGAAMWG